MPADKQAKYPKDSGNDVQTTTSWRQTIRLKPALVVLTLAEETHLTIAELLATVSQSPVLDSDLPRQERGPHRAGVRVKLGLPASAQANSGALKVWVVEGLPVSGSNSY